MENVFKSYKLYVQIRFQHAVSSYKIYSKIVQSKQVLVFKCSFKFSIEKTAECQIYVLHKKKAENSLGKLLLLLIFMLFYMKCMNRYSYRSISGTPSKTYDRAFLQKKSEQFLAFNYFRKKRFFIDVWNGSECASELKRQNFSLEYG